MLQRSLRSVRALVALALVFAAAGAFAADVPPQPAPQKAPLNAPLSAPALAAPPSLTDAPPPGAPTLPPAVAADAPAPLDEDEVDPPPFVDAGDLKAIQKRGFLRVLVEGGEAALLPRDGRGPQGDEDLVREFARRRGLKVQFVRAASFTDLIPMLNGGQADVIVDDLTVTDAREELVAFTSPTAVVKELVVGKKGAKGLPKSVGELAGKEIHVRASSSYADTLAQLAKDKGLSFKLVAAPETLDPEQLVYDVAHGKRPLTVVDSHMLKAISGYNADAEGLFPIAEGRNIAWAVRKQNRELRAALDAFIQEKALTQHSEERLVGDLDALRTRGSLRVLTRNNPVTYFLHRGERFGFDYTMAGLAAKALGLRLEMIVAPSHDQLVTWLKEGRGDVIASAFSVTPERAQEVAFSQPYLWVDEVLVQRVKGPKVKALADLKGKKIHVRKSSSYYRTLSALRPQYGFEIVPVAEDVETEVLLDRLGQGKIDFTVADSHILQVERAYNVQIEPAFELPLVDAEGKELAAPGPEGTHAIAFAVRPENAQLKAALDDFVKKTYRGVVYNMARKQYFENKRSIAIGGAETDRPGTISPFDAVIKRHSKAYGFDWRLMAAQAFQESHFDPKAKSWVGAKGLFQVMPATGKALGFVNLEDPEEGAHAGIKYVSKLLDQLDPKIPFKHRLRMALAAYNVGLGHVLDAQRLAVELKLDPHKWFGHVERAMLLLAQPKYAAKARHGYCRGAEPVKYVSEIQNRYDNYVKVIPE